MTESVKAILACRGFDYLSITESFMPSNRRIPYQRDKTADQRFFLLTLLGIAKELELNPNIEKGDLIQVQMPIDCREAFCGTL